ncbi:MAG TPA: ABC transporter ATP-binding protein [Acidimicrobiales bacterium]|nr:ABC transporter ATP-binding protein [Acidimicrobiales bacterium]
MNGPAADPAVASDTVITADRAAVTLGGRPVWSDLSLEVGAGEFVAVLGPNGAGKSTLARAVLGLVPLAAGSLRVLGERPGRHNDAIGYLPQRRSFDPGLRVRGRDIVRLGLDGDRWGLPLPWRSRHGDEARVAETIAMVGGEAFADRPVGEMSGGEQQRLLVAQALVRRPRLLILDEPLDSLDLPNQAAVAALVAEVCADGVAVVMVAHDVNPILPYVDRVVYLGRGAAVSGRPAEVITSSTLSGLFGTPIEVLHASDGRMVVVGQPEPPAYHADRHAHS